MAAGFSIGSLIGAITITGAATAQAQIMGVQRAMALTGDTAAAAASGIGASEAALVGAGRAATVAAGGTGKMRAAQLTAVAATERYNLVLSDQTATVGRLASSEASLIRANERVATISNSAAAATERQAAAQRASAVSAAEAAAAGGRMSGAFGSAIATAGKLGFAIGAFELARKAISIGKEAIAFQKSMLLVQTQAGATAAEVKTLSTSVLGMAGSVGTAPEKLATSLYHVYSVGLRGAKALDVVRIAAEGAKVGNADLEQTTNALTATVASGISGVQNMAQAMGALNTIVGAGDMKLSDLNEAMGSGILVVAKQFGLSLTDVGAALATFGDNNIRGANAATMLRVSITSMAKPVAGGAKELESMGLTAQSLADDMQKGGLNQALHDLSDHLKAAGIHGAQVGEVLTTAFGKKAGPGIAVLIDQLARFDSKEKAITDGAGNFGAQWTATTKTTSFQLNRLNAQFEAAGISVARKLTPALGTAAGWLATTLPKAVSTLQAALAPLEHIVGVALVGAWKALSAVLGVVGTVLAGVGHWMASNKDLVTAFGATVLGMWAAFKGYEIATLAIGLVNKGLGTMVLRASSAAASLRAVATGEATASIGAFAIGLAAVGVAIYAVGKTISGWVESSNSAVGVMNNLRASTDSFRDALQQTNGVLTDSVRLSVAKQLQDSGLAAKAAAAGISLKALTTGVTGSDAAMQALIASWKASGAPSDDTIAALGMMHISFKGAALSAKDLATVITAVTGATTGAGAAATGAAQSLQWLVTANGTIAQTMVKTGANVDVATEALKAQTVASGLLKQSLDLLNGVATSVETTADTFSIALGGLRDKTTLFKDANGNLSTSLKQSTVAGATNRQMLVGLIGNAKDAAQAVADQAAKHHSLSQALLTGNASLKKGEDAIRAAAVAAGFDKGLVDTLITSLGKLSTVKPAPTVNLNDKASPKARAIQKQIDSIKQQDIPGVNVNTRAAFDQIVTLENRLYALTHANYSVTIGGVTRGSTSAGTPVAAGGPIHGPGTGTSDSIPALLSNGEYVIRASQTAKHRQLVEAINSGTHGFAAGGPVGFASGGAAVGGKIAADMAALSAAMSKTASEVSGAFYTLLGVVRSAGAGAGLTGRLTGYERSMAGRVTARNNYAAQGVQAHADQAAEVASVASAASGTFNLTAAGGDTPTFGAITAEASHDLAVIKTWTAGLKRLGATFGKSTTGKAMLRQLAEAGPSTLPQVQALLAASPSQLAGLVGTQYQINQAAAGAGSYAGGVQYDAQIAGLRSKISIENKAINSLDRKIADGIAHGLTGIRITIDARGIARLVSTGNAKNRPRT